MLWLSQLQRRRHSESLSCCKCNYTLSFVSWLDDPNHARLSNSDCGTRIASTSRQLFGERRLAKAELHNGTLTVLSVPLGGHSLVNTTSGFIGTADGNSGLADVLGFREGQGGPSVWQLLMSRTMLSTVTSRSHSQCQRCNSEMAGT